LAFDRLSVFPGYFHEHILADKLDSLNISFLVDRVERAHGGTVGNIAYNLFLLQEKPLIISAVGNDPDGQDYLERFKSWDLSTEHILVADLATAGAFVATDKANNQLTFFNPGAMMGTETDFNPHDLPQPADQHLAIVSPGGKADMLRLSRLYQEQGVKYIFDPGQQVPVFSGDELLAMMDGSLMLIANYYEIEVILKKTGQSLEDLFQFTTAIVTTLGDNGSRLTTPRSTQHIMPGPAEMVVNPTGAGDAYRAGVLKALYHGESILTACRLGSTVASFCVEAKCTQDHYFTPGTVLARHFRTFKEPVNCLV
jgi:adenosine kinase